MSFHSHPEAEAKYRHCGREVKIIGLSKLMDSFGNGKETIVTCPHCTAKLSVKSIKFNNKEVEINAV